MKIYDWVAFTLPIIGGINWGLVGLADFDAVKSLMGSNTTATRIVYGLVGLSALYLAVVGLSRLSECSSALEGSKQLEEVPYGELDVVYRSDLISPAHEMV